MGFEASSRYIVEELTRIVVLPAIDRRVGEGAGVETSPHLVSEVSKYRSEFPKRPAETSQEPLDQGQEPRVAVRRSWRAGIESCCMCKIHSDFEDLVREKACKTISFSHFCIVKIRILYIKN